MQRNRQKDEPSAGKARDAGVFRSEWLGNDAVTGCRRSTLQLRRRRSLQRQKQAPTFASTDAVFQAAAAGVLVAAMVQLSAALAGFGLIEDLYQAGRGAPFVSIAGVFWVAASALAFAIGGFASARLADAHRFRDALFCGLLTFSSALLAAVVILTLRPPALVDRSLGPVGNAVAAMAVATRVPSPDASVELSALRGEVQMFLDPASAEDRVPDRAGTSRSDTGTALTTVFAGIDERRTKRPLQPPSMRSRLRPA